MTTYPGDYDRRRQYAPIGEDERKEAFTLKRFNSGEIVGGELL